MKDYDEYRKTKQKYLENLRSQGRLKDCSIHLYARRGYILRMFCSVTDFITFTENGRDLPYREYRRLLHTLSTRIRRRSKKPYKNWILSSERPDMPPRPQEDRWINLDFKKALLSHANDKRCIRMTPVEKAYHHYMLSYHQLDLDESTDLSDLLYSRKTVFLDEIERCKKEVEDRFIKKLDKMAGKLSPSVDEEEGDVEDVRDVAGLNMLLNESRLILDDESRRLFDDQSSKDLLPMADNILSDHILFRQNTQNCQNRDKSHRIYSDHIKEKKNEHKREEQAHLQRAVLAITRDSVGDEESQSISEERSRDKSMAVGDRHIRNDTRDGSLGVETHEEIMARIRGRHPIREERFIKRVRPRPINS